MLIDITPDSLKSEAEEALRAQGVDIEILSGYERAITVSMMASFACQILMRELNELGILVEDEA